MEHAQEHGGGERCALNAKFVIETMCFGAYEPAKHSKLFIPNKRIHTDFSIVINDKSDSMPFSQPSPLRSGGSFAALHRESG